MYLPVTTLALLLRYFLPYVGAECGCQLDRNAQCNGDSLETDPTVKYLKKSNTYQYDNNADLYSSPKAFNHDNMKLIEQSTFEMGTNDVVFEADMEGPVRNVSVDSFYIDKYEVTNEDFEKFVENAKYITEAEKFGDSFVFELFIPKEKQEDYKNVRAVQAPWWIKMGGASWFTPEGPGSDLSGICRRTFFL